MISTLTCLAISDPERAAEQIRCAMHKAAGSRALAAKILGVPLRTFHRVASRLGMDLGPSVYDVALEARRSER